MQAISAASDLLYIGSNDLIDDTRQPLAKNTRPHLRVYRRSRGRIFGRDGGDLRGTLSCVLAGKTTDVDATIFVLSTAEAVISRNSRRLQ